MLVEYGVFHSHSQETTGKTDNNLAKASEKQYNRCRNPTLLQHRPCQSNRHTFPSRNLTN